MKVNKGENRSVYVKVRRANCLETHLQQLFVPHGKVVSCKIYKDELERPKGDALVTFAGGLPTSGSEGPRRDLGPCV